MTTKNRDPLDQEKGLQMRDFSTRQGDESGRIAPVALGRSQSVAKFFENSIVRADLFPRSSERGPIEAMITLYLYHILE